MALQYAARLAEHFRAQLTVLSVVDPLLAAASATYLTDLTEKTHADLRRFAASAVPDLEQRVGAVQVEAVMGDVVPEILRMAAQSDADVIVMGTQGLSGYRKIFIGSNTERVLRHTEVPVLAVPPLVGADVLVPIGQLAASLDVILAPVDFSDSSNHALGVAAAIAHALSARLVLLHAVPPVHALDAWSKHATELERKNLAEAQQRITALGQSIRTSACIEVRVGTPADVITAVSTERKARLIVMGLRGAGGVFGPATGSIAYRVLCLTPIPVLALPTRKGSSKDHESLWVDQVVGQH
jgi:nucleotide-binding universal stress UspA family protein